MGTGVGRIPCWQWGLAPYSRACQAPPDGHRGRQVLDCVADRLEQRDLGVEGAFEASRCDVVEVARDVRFVSTPEASAAAMSPLSRMPPRVSTATVARATASSSASRMSGA